MNLVGASAAEEWTQIILKLEMKSTYIVIIKQYHEDDIA